MISDCGTTKHAQCRAEARSEAERFGHGIPIAPGSRAEMRRIGQRLDLPFDL